MKKYFTLFLLCFLYSSTIKAQFTGKPQYQITTKRAGVLIGNINIELFPLIAPLHSGNFDSLVNDHFFDTTAFHRVIPNFMIQGGDPNSRHGPKATWGYGGSVQTVNAEFTAAKHLRGRLSAARDNDTNSASSQFFICVVPYASLDGQYSVYGQVVSGMNFADSIVNSPRDANDNPLLKIEMFITYIGSNDSVPDKPNLVSPVNNTQGIAASPVLNWTAVNTAVVYQIEIATDSLFANMFLAKDVGTNSVTVNNLAGLTTYYWRVKTNNGGKFSQYSDVWSFNTVTGAPVLVSPANNSTGIATNPVLNWNPVQGATSYHLQVNSNVNFSQFNMVFDMDSIINTSYQVDSLLSNKAYYWRVYSNKDGVEGFLSSKFKFTTGTTSIDLIQDKDNLLLQNFPNPCNEFTTITYKLLSSKKIILKIYDIQGRELTNLISEIQPQGEYSVIIDTKEYSGGVYFYQLTIGNMIETKKMVVLH